MYQRKTGQPGPWAEVLAAKIVQAFFNGEYTASSPGDEPTARSVFKLYAPGVQQFVVAPPEKLIRWWLCQLNYCNGTIPKRAIDAKRTSYSRISGIANIRYQRTIPVSWWNYTS